MSVADDTAEVAMSNKLSKRMLSCFVLIASALLAQEESGSVPKKLRYDPELLALKEA